jgi:G3E family GTPase
MADPLPIMQVFFQEDSFQLKFRLNAIVAVVDCHKVAQVLSNSSKICNGTYTNPMQHLQTSIADRIFLHNELPICAEQEAIERHVRGIYPIPLLRLPPYSDGSTNLLELDLSDLDHLDAELKRRGQNDGNLEFPLPRPSLLQGSWRISFQLPGDLSMHLCSRWIEKLFLAHDIIRYQGVFSVKGKHEKYIFHGVHGGFWSGGFSSSRWNHQQRVNQFLAVVIPSASTDRRRELQQTLNACLATKLRFAVGEVVQVMIAKKWQVGRIAGLWDEGNPYCVQLKSDGRDVLVPNDEDCFVRKRPKHLNSKKLKTRPRS